MPVLSRKEQRAVEMHRKMLPIQLQCHLLNLAREIKEGPVEEKMAKLQEFQQFIQYAPPEMKMKVFAIIEGEEEEFNSIPYEDEELVEA